jgi:hypothetical protein
MQLSEPFKLNDEGYALLQKFILLRIEKDINCEKNVLEVLLNKKQQTMIKSGFFNTINRFHKEQSVNNIEDRIRKKEDWKDKWTVQNISIIKDSLIHIHVHDLINRFKETVTGRIQLFLILQEVVHTPIYNALDSLESAGDEKNFEETIIEISNLCGLNNIGKKIIEDTNTFFKDIKRENTNILKWGLYGFIGISAVAAIIAMPVIAPAIGGLMGLSGAAATASGLAFLGGGSVAAGGLGMAGGMTVLVGGSGILGAIAGGAAGKLISQLPQEAIALNVVKVVNLINFLKSKDNPDYQNTDDILSTARSLFLEFKQVSEKELVLNGIHKDKKDSVKFLDILNVGLKRIL